MRKFVIMLWIFLSGVSALSAQEIEIFIPGENDEQLDGASADAAFNPLAQCLASGEKSTCQGITLNPSANNLESFVVGDIFLETFILDLNHEEDAIPKQPAQAGQVNNAGQTIKTITITSVGTHIEFNFDSDHVMGHQISKLDAFSEALNHPVNASFSFAILGHTDSVGQEFYNCDLSGRRAQRVADELRARGVYVTLIPIGVGEGLHKDKENPENGVNRRVSFINLGEHQGPEMPKFRSYCG